MAIIFTIISHSLNILIQMCLLYGNISKFCYPGVFLPAAAGLIFKCTHRKCWWRQNCCKVRITSCTVLFILAAVMNITSVAELCCTIFRVKTCLQFNRGCIYISSRETWPFMGVIRLWFCVQSYLSFSEWTNGEQMFTKICSDVCVKLWSLFVTVFLCHSCCFFFLCQLFDALWLPLL